MNKLEITEFDILKEMEKRGLPMRIVGNAKMTDGEGHMAFWFRSADFEQVKSDLLRPLENKWDFIGGLQTSGSRFIILRNQLGKVMYYRDGDDGPWFTAEEMKSRFGVDVAPVAMPSNMKIVE